MFSVRFPKNGSAIQIISDSYTKKCVSRSYANRRHTKFMCQMLVTVNKNCSRFSTSMRKLELKFASLFPWIQISHVKLGHIQKLDLLNEGMFLNWLWKSSFFIELCVKVCHSQKLDLLNEGMFLNWLWFMSFFIELCVKVCYAQKSDLLDEGMFLNLLCFLAFSLSCV